MDAGVVDAMLLGVCIYNYKIRRDGDGMESRHHVALCRFTQYRHIFLAISARKIGKLNHHTAKDSV